MQSEHKGQLKCRMKQTTVRCLVKRDPNETDWRSSPITGSKDAPMSFSDAECTGENTGSRSLGKGRESRSGEPGCLFFNVAARGAINMGVFYCR